MHEIVIRGARQHNLKDISLTLPHDRLIVITGVSGCGKSSLAFDTLYAEGQRRYLESLSLHTRQFYQQMDRPEIDAVEGLRPPVAIEQRSLPRQPRSTVGTLTEIHDFLRLLYARLGTIHCPTCATAVRAHTIPEMIVALLAWPSASRLWILAPLGKITARSLPKRLGQIARDGFLRVRIDGTIHTIDAMPHLPRAPVYLVEVVVDRLLLQPDRTQRLAESLELAARVGAGTVRVARDLMEEKTFCERLQCGACGRIFDKLTPSHFSFNHPLGACPTCHGIGRRDALAEDPLGDPCFTAEDRTLPGSFWSLATVPVCEDCQGSRLNDRARAVTLAGLGLHQVNALPLDALDEWLADLPLTPVEHAIADRPLEEIRQRLRTLRDFGLGYLNLERSGHTLSSGEAQRIRLTQHLGAQLSGLLYVLDEPSTGLHARDHARLLELVMRLRDAGNTVVIVEHDPATILQADFVVDLGPGAGAAGGEVLFAGTPRQLLDHPTSLTGHYLSGRKQITFPRSRRPFARGSLEVIEARGHNLKNISVAIPIGSITCVTGVSGSGKSTLVIHTLYRALRRQLHRAQELPLPFARLEGAEQLDKVIHIDQSPADRTPRSNASTVSGLFTLVRALFARLPEAKARGYRPERFSFNVKGGRCETCKGVGIQWIGMAFLPAVRIRCPACSGTRYRGQTLEILYKGQSIADVLAMTVEQAQAFFENFPPMRRKLALLQEVGLGYVRLGQPSTELSGGESQRLKLSRELGRKATGRTLYILDEPTSGLHLEDIQRLLHVLQRLADLGNTVVIIEHHLEVIRAADHVIDLGPEGGGAGGFVVAAGPPETIARDPRSHTGFHLRRLVTGTQGGGQR